MQETEYKEQKSPEKIPVKPANPSDLWQRHDGAAVEAVYGKETGPTVTTLDTLLRGIVSALRAKGIYPTTEETP